MVGVFMFDRLANAFNALKGRPQVISFDDLPSALGTSSGINSFYNGDKFGGGFGDTLLLEPDYWTLRARSAELYNTNIYARGLIRRLVTNEINTGLTLEATPIQEILNIDEDTLSQWAEAVENRFTIWGKNKQICDYLGEQTYGALQKQIRIESLVNGDVLVVLRVSKETNLPSLQIIAGSRVQTPLNSFGDSAKDIQHGVEFDKKGRQIAYHVVGKNGISSRIPAYGKKSNRRMSWLVYGSDKRHGEVRGQPILSLVLQSLKEIDRYRDSEQRAAVINSMVAMFIKKTQDKPGTKPMSGLRLRRDTVESVNGDNKRSYNLDSHVPGMVFETLQQGEEPVSFDNKRPNVNYATFETAILNAIAWSNEMPPEILLLQFGSNYSASRGAVNEFKMYLNKVRVSFSEQTNEIVYPEWLISEVFNRNIQAPGLLEAWDDPKGYNVAGAWFSSEWGGAIKPSVDLAKEVKGYKGMVQEGWIDNDRASKELTGTKFSLNIRRIKRQNQQKADAMRPMLELEREFGTEAVDNSTKALANLTEAVEENATKIEDMQDQAG